MKRFLGLSVFIFLAACMPPTISTKPLPNIVETRTFIDLQNRNVCYFNLLIADDVVILVTQNTCLPMREDE